MVSECASPQAAEHDAVTEMLKFPWRLALNPTALAQLHFKRAIEHLSCFATP